MESYSSYTILPESHLIVTNFQGSITIKDIIHLNLLFIADKSYDSTFDLLMDFRDSTALAFKMDITDFFDFFKKNVFLKKRIRNGILHSTPNQKYLVSVYAPTASLMKIDVKDFKEIESYFEWMQYSDDEQLTIKEKLKSIKSILAD